MPTGTLRDWVIAGITWIIKHPKVITITMPITRNKIRTAYNSENPGYSFDTELINFVQSSDASYLAYSNSELLAMIESANPGEEEISATDIGYSAPSGGGE